MELKRVLTVIAILLTEFCERLTFYSISGNLILYLQSILQIPTLVSVSISLAFTGTVSMIPILGGWLADSYMGRYRTVLGSLVVFLVGACMLPITSFDLIKSGFISLESKRIIYFIGLVLIGLGTGGIKANVSTFGAQQIVEEGEGVVQAFFNWFYWLINLGSAIAFTVVAYVQQEISFFTGYLIPACCILLALIIFLIPKSQYYHERPQGSAFNSLFSIAKQGIRNRKKSHQHHLSFVDHARQRNGGTYDDVSVDGFLTVMRMLPIFISLIMFWTIYSQNQSTFVVQAERMNANLGGWLLPVVSLSLFDTFTILIMTPIIDRLIYPLCLKVMGSYPSMLSRMGLGMIFASIAAAIAGIVEIERKNDILRNGFIPQHLSGANISFNASTMSILYQIPQFATVGLGEIFTSISSLEFSFSEAPDHLKSVIMGLNLCTTGIGSYLGSALMSIVNLCSPKPWVPSDINNGHFEYFCFLQSGLMLLNFICYIPIAQWYKRTKRGRNEYETLVNRSESFVTNP